MLRLEQRTVYKNFSQLRSEKLDWQTLTFPNPSIIFPGTTSPYLHTYIYSPTLSPPKPSTKPPQPRNKTNPPPNSFTHSPHHPPPKPARSKHTRAINDAIKQLRRHYRRARTRAECRERAHRPRRTRLVEVHPQPDAGCVDDDGLDEEGAWGGVSETGSNVGYLGR
jgi:hypothetical protein